MSFITQDWTPVVVGKNKAKVLNLTGGSTSSSSASKKSGSSSAKPKETSAQAFYKVDTATDAQHVQTVNLDTRIRIQQARQLKGWSQLDLARAISEKPTIINEYESGKAIPNQAIISKMEKALGINLRGQQKKKKKPSASTSGSQ